MKRKFYGVKGTALILMLLFSVFIISACQKTIDENTNIEIEDERPSTGGSIIIASAEPKSLNPLLGTSKTYNDTANLIFEKLFEYNGRLELEPELAEIWKNIPGTADFLVKLKNSAVWSDGSELTAEDVKFSLDTIKANPQSIYYKNLEHISDYQVVDSKTIKITFDQVFANAIDMLVFPIVPRASFQNSTNQIPLCSGPFKISKYNNLKFMELVANDKWIGNAKPYIEKITVMFINDQEAFSTAFQSRELDLINTTSYDWEKYKEMKNVKTYKYQSLYYDFIGFNFNTQIFQDKAVRKAVMFGINRKAIVDKYLLGNANITDVPIMPGSWLNDGKGVTYNYSKSEALNLLKQAGFSDINNDKILEREVAGKIQSLRFTLITNEENEFRKKAAEEIKKNLEEIGFRVDIKLLPFEEIKASLDNKNFDLVLAGYNMSPTQDLTFAFHSNLSTGEKNFISYNNPEMDLLLMESYGTLNKSYRKDRYIKLQELIREELPYGSLFFREAAIVTSDKIKGNISPNVINPYNGIETWFISKNRK